MEKETHPYSHSHSLHIFTIHPFRSLTSRLQSAITADASPHVIVVEDSSLFLSLGVAPHFVISWLRALRALAHLYPVRISMEKTIEGFKILLKPSKFQPKKKKEERKI